jgi:uncharacterized protein YjbI with pentapeptide repeats
MPVARYGQVMPSTTRRALLIAILLVLSACSGDGGESAETSSPPDTSVATTPAPSTATAPEAGRSTTTTTATPVEPAPAVVACESGSGPDFTGQDLSGLGFDGQTLACATFDQATLARISMIDTDASGASFRDTIIDEASFEGASLVGADFGRATFSRARFVGADLTGADLRTADLGSARWLDATCPDGVNSEEAGGSCDGHLEPVPVEFEAGDAAVAVAPIEFVPLCAPDSGDDYSGQDLVSPDLRRADLRCADFAGATVEAAQFDDVDASGSVFAGAVINESRFAGTALFGADFTGAVVTRVQFEHSNLIGADIVDTEFVDTRWLDTICPNGVNSDDAGGTCLGSRTALDLPVAEFDEVTDADITVREGQGLTTYTIASDLLFDFDADEPTADAAAKLDQVIGSITARFAANDEIQVWGHADAVGDPAYNLDLSQRRADNVAATLGAAPELAGYRIVAIGLGEAQPVAPNTNPDGSDNPEGRAANRRVEIVVRTG